MPDTDTIDIKGLPRGAVLAALYNRARPLGMGFLHYNPAPMSPTAGDDLLARAALDGSRCYFDYLHGRVMKVDLAGDTLDTRLYDRDNGDGAAAEVIANLRAEVSA